MKITYEIAMAAGRDAANRQARKNKRKKWNKEDHALTCKITDKLLDRKEN